MIVIIGPTGETARRILRYAQADGVDLRLLARDPVAAKNKLGSLAGDFSLEKADARDQDAIAAALKPGDVLLNATTPAGELGHGLARAAIRAGAHYTAFTGEVMDSLRLLRELDEAARERSVTLCPGTGALGDFVLRMAIDAFPGATAGCVGTAIDEFTPSYGTLVSESHIMAGLGLVIEDGSLTEEDVAGRIIKRGGKTLVERPLMDPIMVSRWTKLKSFRSGIEVPPEAAEQVAQMFRETAARLRSEAGLQEYMQEIRPASDRPIPENDESLPGRMTAMVWSGDEEVSVSISRRPVYEGTARAALLVSRELDELEDRPSGFQAASSIVRSIDYALTALKFGSGCLRLPCRFQ